MDSFIYSIHSTIPIFLVMIVGWIIKKCQIIDDNFVSKANKYVFHVALPVLLYKDLSKADFVSQFDITFVLFCVVVTTIMFLGVWGLTELFMKEDTMKGAFVQASCRSSAAILGIAFIQNMYSDAGMAPLMILAAVPLFNIFSVVILTFKAHEEVFNHSIDNTSYINKNSTNVDKANCDINKDKINCNIDKNKVNCNTDKIDTNIDKANINNKKAILQSCMNIVRNPIIIGIFIGFIASLAHIKLPVVFDKAVESIAQTATPMALICIGAGFEGRKAIKKIRPTLIAAFIKIIGLAVLFLPVAVWMGFRNQELVAILIMLASPTTVTAYIMAKNMYNDEVLTSSVVVVTTFLSSITLTGWIYILRTFNLI